MFDIIGLRYEGFWTLYGGEWDWMGFGLVMGMWSCGEGTGLGFGLMVSFYFCGIFRFVEDLENLIIFIY